MNECRVNPNSQSGNLFVHTDRWQLCEPITLALVCVRSIMSVWIQYESVGVSVAEAEEGKRCCGERTCTREQVRRLTQREVCGVRMHQRFSQKLSCVQLSLLCHQRVPPFALIHSFIYISPSSTQTPAVLPRPRCFEPRTEEENTQLCTCSPLGGDRHKSTSVRNDRQSAPVHSHSSMRTFNCTCP